MKKTPIILMITMLVLATATLGAIADNLTGSWKLNATSGSNHYDELGLYNLTSDNAEDHTFQYGRSGYAVWMDGNDFESGSFPDFACGTNLTISMWYNTSTALSGEALISLYNAGSTAPAISFRSDGGKFLDYYANDGFAVGQAWTSTNDLPDDGEWHHLLYRREFCKAEQPRLLIDGTLYAGSWTDGDGSLNPATIDTIKIGTERNSFWIGHIDEVNIYTRRLESTEEQQLYNGSYPYYPFDPPGVNFTIKANSLNGTPIQEFNATLFGQTYETGTGTIRE